MRRSINVTVNGRAEVVDVVDTWTLAQLLREGLRLKGTKEGCGEGSCGSCTVLVDGELARACLTLAVRCEGREVLTIEGLAEDDRLEPLQTAFVECGAVQCGFCSPGFIVTAKVLLRDSPHPTKEQIREHFAGNFCRCGGYSFIMDAVEQAAGLAPNETT